MLLFRFSSTQQTLYRRKMKGGSREKNYEQLVSGMDDSRFVLLKFDWTDTIPVPRSGL
jgi:hypothetical protein